MSSKHLSAHRLVPVNLSNIRYVGEFSKKKEKLRYPDQLLKRIFEGSARIEDFSYSTQQSVRGRWRKLPQEVRDQYPELAEHFARVQQELDAVSDLSNAKTAERRAAKPNVDCSFLYGK